MSRFNHPLPFSPHYEFRVLRVVTINGRMYLPGDRLDKAALAERRLRQMYENRVISPMPPEVLPALLQPPRQPEPTDPPSQPAPPRQDLDPDDGDDVVNQGEAQAAAESQPAAGEFDGPKLVHRGFGRWFVVAADGAEQGPMSKAEAEAAVAT